MRLWYLLGLVALADSKPFGSPRAVEYGSKVRRQQANPTYVPPGPNDPINEWTAIGDSYSSGVGSLKDDYDPASGKCSRYGKSFPAQIQAAATGQGGWPGPQVERIFNFGACLGDLIANVKTSQIGQQAVAPYVNFGKPSVATMTISGNDLGFANIVIACLYNVVQTSYCEQYLGWAEGNVTLPEFSNKIVQLLKDVTASGRTYGGASFQLFVNGYTPFFNEVDTGCDTQTFAAYGTGGTPLTTAFRHRLNQLVLNLNSVIRAAVAAPADAGIFYVEGYQDDYVGHQFCDPAAGPTDAHNEKPVWNTIYFWDYHSPWDDTEGPNPPAPGIIPAPTNPADDPSIQLLNALIPDPANRDLITSGKKQPWDVSPAFASPDAFWAALDGLQDSKYSDSFRRVFHPKATPYGVQAQRNLDAITAARSPVSLGPGVPTTGNGSVETS